MFENPNYVSPDFAIASLGYLSAPARRLNDLLSRLPPPVSRREQAIVSAVEWGVGNGPLWDRALQPLRLERRATFSVRNF
jgi:hypothetical protein